MREVFNSFSKRPLKDSLINAAKAVTKKIVDISNPFLKKVDFQISLKRKL